MAWVAEHHLAAAVSEAGGFGRCGKCTAGDCPGRDPEGKRADGQAIWCEYYASESEC